MQFSVSVFELSKAILFYIFIGITTNPALIVCTFYQGSLDLTNLSLIFTQIYQFDLNLTCTNYSILSTFT